MRNISELAGESRNAFTARSQSTSAHLLETHRRHIDLQITTIIEPQLTCHYNIHPQYTLTLASVYNIHPHPALEQSAV